MPLSLEDIAPGLVVHLDTSVLRSLGGSSTNAELAASGDRAVTGSHDFLIVGFDRTTGVCTAVPLFPKSAVGNQPLEESHKSGQGSDWIGTTVYFSRWQHWRIPSTALVAAAGKDDAAPAARRRYASGDGAALDDVRVWESHNRAPYREA